MVCSSSPQRHHNALLITSYPLRDSPMVGALWESAVFAELRKAQSLHSGRWDLCYFRDRSREADFCSYRAGRLQLADATWAEQPDHNDANKLAAILDLLGEDLCTPPAHILCRSSLSHPLTDRVHCRAAQDIGSLFS